jgi:hypothetical protein
MVIFPFFNDGIFSNGTGTNSATAVSLYIYFSPTLTQNEFADDFIGRQFRAGLISLTEDGVQKLKLRDKYVLARNDQPAPAADVGMFFMFSETTLIKLGIAASPISPK